ncbi:MAG: hypothetical protein ACREP5_17090, partial [Candidatus Binatia bacterium]
MSEAAKLVCVDQRCAELRLKVLGYTRDVIIDPFHRLVRIFTHAKRYIQVLTGTGHLHLLCSKGKETISGKGAFMGTTLITGLGLVGTSYA